MIGSRMSMQSQRSMEHRRTLSSGSISYSLPGTPRGGDQERLMRGYDVENQPQQFGLEDLAEDSAEESEGHGNGTVKLQKLNPSPESTKMNGSYVAAGKEER
jgi:hypothetical protein